MAEIVGQDPHPRALLFAVAKEHLASIASCFPVSKAFESPQDVVMAEWDVVVSEDSAPDWLAPHLYVISFGAGAHVRPADTAGFTMGGPTTLGRWYTSPARQLVIPDNLPQAVSHLVRAELAPAAHSASRNDGGNTVIVEGFSKARYKNSAINAISPFLYTAEGALPIAGSWTRKGGAEVWSLPPSSNRPSWIKAALEVWSEKDPARFPRPRWKDDPQWATAAEVRLRAEHDEIAANRAAALTQYDADLNRSATLIRAATVEADAGIRALLLAQGDTLVIAVERALRELGFVVRNMDLETPEDDRREDLRVSLPGSDWTAIVEVRGYKGGAAVNDLLRIQRFARRYTKETSREPDAQWYIVNQFVGRDPADRREPLQSNPEELRVFADDGGLVADTRDLFRLARAIDLDSLPKETARKSLIECRGVFLATAAGVSR